MAIRVNLDLLLVRRRMTLTELSGRVGITLANLSILKNERARAIRFSTLDALCRELRCQPGDILEYEPEERKEPRVSGEPDGADESDVADQPDASGSSSAGSSSATRV